MPFFPLFFVLPLYTMRTSLATIAVGDFFAILLLLRGFVLIYVQFTGLCGNMVEISKDSTLHRRLYEDLLQPCIWVSYVFKL